MKQAVVRADRGKGRRAKGSRPARHFGHEEFQIMVRHFEKSGDLRMQIICVLLSKGIRVGDLLRTIRIQDVFKAGGEPRENLTYREQKTGKVRTITLIGQNPVSLLAKALVGYFPEVADLPRDSVLFYNKRDREPLRDKGVKYLLAQFVRKGLVDQCSPHSFRKYGARRMLDNGRSIEVISRYLNHSSTRVTRTYLDIQQEDLRRAEEVLEF